MKSEVSLHCHCFKDPAALAEVVQWTDKINIL